MTTKIINHIKQILWLHSSCQCGNNIFPVTCNTDIATFSEVPPPADTAFKSLLPNCDSIVTTPYCT